MSFKQQRLSYCVNRIEEFIEKLDEGSPVSTFGKLREMASILHALAIAIEIDDTIQEKINEHHDYNISANLSDIQYDMLMEFFDKNKIDHEISMEK